VLSRNLKTRQHRRKERKNKRKGKKKRRNSNNNNEEEKAEKKCRSLAHTPEVTIQRLLWLVIIQ
jgi:hypothetical protein